jgi:hypothetical protein
LNIIENYHGREVMSRIMALSGEKALIGAAAPVHGLRVPGFSPGCSPAAGKPPEPFGAAKIFLKIFLDYFFISAVKWGPENNE